MNFKRRTQIGAPFFNKENLYELYGDRQQPPELPQL